ncbi:Organ specific protein [Corchorus olitorius]|uniref:Organ specific protein n=1 Tax=Corchorus olitorius TaxID=93759 RepID=A0A1R3HZE1_9ROSI|nr:Organ specific protein [Corchorus olitorius]
MKSFLSFFGFLSLLLLADTIAAARKDAGEYWRVVMKDESIPEAIESALVRVNAAAASSSGDKTDCHDSPKNMEIKEEKIIVEEFELPRPNNYNRVEGGKTKAKSFADDFEPRPNVSAYGDDSQEKSSFAKEFEPRPNISAYSDGDLKGEKKSFVEDFEPRPNISAYSDGDLKGEKKSFANDFEPRPNISTYHD